MAKFAWSPNIVHPYRMRESATSGGNYRTGAIGPFAGCHDDLVSDKAAPIRKLARPASVMAHVNPFVHEYDNLAERGRQAKRIQRRLQSSSGQTLSLARAARRSLS